METSVWCGLIGAASIICVIIEFLIPPGKTGKTMNIILSLFIMASLIDLTQHQRRSKNFKIFKTDSIALQSQNKKFTSKIESQTDTLINQGLETIIRDNLKDFKINPEKIEIFTDKNEDNCIVMIRCKIYVRKEELKFAIKAKETIEKELNISTEFEEV